MSFDIATSGLAAASADLNVIGNNIANSSSTGFKSSRAEFGDVFAANFLGAPSEATGDGVAVTSITQQFDQGNIEFTSDPLDLAINGDGFFVLAGSDGTSYTRAGNFQVNEEGFVVSASGSQLQAFTADNGDITGNIGSIQLNSALIEPNPTTSVETNVNLNSSEDSPLAPFAAPFDAFATPPTSPSSNSFNSSSSVTVFDSLGNSHTLETFYVKTPVENEWEAYTLIDGVSTSGPETLTFQSNGQFDDAILPVQLDITGWQPLDDNGAPNGAGVQSITVDLTGSTQFGSPFGVNSLSQDGFAAGQLTGINVDDSGVIFAQFTNGQSNALGQVALAGFNSPTGLQPIGNTEWLETFGSGPPTINDPGTGGLGVIQSGALEESNVELTEELVDMILAQRNFQASAQVITTADEITQTIINIG